MAYPVNSVLYNGFDITGIPGLLIQNVDVQQLPKRALETYKLARQNGEAVVSTFFDYREIVVTGAFVTQSKASFEAARDTLLNYIAQPSGTFDTTIAGALRRYTVTLSDNTNVPEFFGGYASIELHFNAYDPFGYDLTATTIAMGTVTSTPTTYSVTFGGTWDSRPLLNFTVSSFTGSGLRDLIITNPLTGRAMTIERTWANADAVIVDMKNMTVTVNGIATAWSGAVPSWNSGAGFIQISDTFTARSIVATGSYVKRYV